MIISEKHNKYVDVKIFFTSYFQYSIFIKKIIKIEY